jgi:ribosomal protein S6--L-glutamate ligase
VASEELSFPIVIKARGGLGKRVWKCNDKSELLERFEILKKENKDDLIILQEYTPNEGDIRVVVWRGKVIASILRKNIDGFLNNISQGGSASQISISKEEERLAIKAAKVIGLDLAGVDLVRSGKETLVFEVNKAPDITSFHKAAKLDIAKVIIDDFLGG